MTTLATGLSQSTQHLPNVAVGAGRVYHLNDWDKPKVWNGQWATARDAGITGPSTAPTVANVAGGSVTAGLHQVRYRYQDTSSEYVSDPSPAQTITAPGGQDLNVTVASSSDAKVDRIVIEMTAVNSTDFYVAKEVMNTGTTYNVDIDDGTLVVQQSVGESWGDFGHEPPPLTASAVLHRGRMFYFGNYPYTLSVTATNSDPGVSASYSPGWPDGTASDWNGRIMRIYSEDGTVDEVHTIASTTDSISLTLDDNFGGATGIYNAKIYRRTPNRIWWSKELYPEGCTILENFRDMLQGRPDRVVAGASFGGDLWIFGRFSSERLVYDNDPGVLEGQVIPVAGNRGAHNQRCVLEVDGSLYCWDRQGIWLAEGSGSKHISTQIDDYLTANAKYDQADSFFLAFEPTMRILHAFFAATATGSYPRWAACLEIDTGNWYLASFLQGIMSATIVPTTAGQVKLMLADVNGYLWFAGTAGSYDGRQGSATNSFAYLSGTTTVTVSPAPADTVVGRMLYRASTGDARLVTSALGSTMTLSSAFSSPALTLGESLYLAPIPVTWQTKWFTGESLGQKKKPLYLFIESIPRAAAVQVEVNIYTDFSTTAETWTTGSLDTFPDGVTVTAGSQTILATLGPDGHVAIPMGSDWKRAYQARVRQLAPTGEFEITAIYFGTDKRTSIPDASE
jgi:hypothetical protein